MKTLILLRHGADATPYGIEHGLWRFESPLTEEGRLEVARVRNAHIDGMDFTYRAHSPLVRARETAEIAVPDKKWEVLEALGPLLPLETWESMTREPEGVPMSMDDVEHRRPGLLSRQTEWTLAALQRIVNEKIGDEEIAIAVSHQPIIGLVRAAFDPSCKETFPEKELPKAGVYRFSFELNGTLLNIEELLPPSA